MPLDARAIARAAHPFPFRAMRVAQAALKMRA